METRVWNKTFILLFAFEMFAQIGANTINPIVSNYAVWLGASYAIAGFLAGINAFVSFAVRPLAGIFLRRFLRRKILLVATIAFVASAILCTVFASLITLGVQRVVFGAAFVFKSALVVAFASSVVPKEKLGQGVGYIGLANVLGAALGPVVASFVSNAMGYPFTCGVGVAFFIIQFIIITMVKDPHEAEQEETFAKLREENAKKSTREIVKAETRLSSMFHLKTVPLALTFICEAFPYGTILMFVLLVSEERGTTGGAFFFAVYVIVCLLLRPLTTRLYDKYGFAKVFLPEGILMCAGIIILVYADSVATFIISAAVFGAGQGALYPSAQSEAVRGRSTQESAMAMNTLYLGADIGMFIGPLISGIILEVATSEIMIWANFAVAVIWVITLAFYVRWRAKDDLKEAEAAAAAKAGQTEVAGEQTGE
ncbi:MAG: MFS transporter [Eggerthellaceae bacterium]|nr:MFS transporter [Eggerthellaceae bacterium]